MSRRGYPTADVYEDRQREFYDNGRRRYAEEYDELDVDISRGQQLPDYLRDGYGRTNAGPLVMRDRQPRRSPSPQAGEVARAPRRRQPQRSPSPRNSEPPRRARQTQPRQPTPRDYQGYQQGFEVDEELLVRRKSRKNRDRYDGASDDDGPRGGGNGRDEEIDVDIQDSRRENGRSRREDIEVDIRQEQYNRARPRQRDVEEIDIDVRRDKTRDRRDFDEEIDVDIRRERPSGRRVDKEEVDVNIKRAARSQSRPRVIAREREEYIYRRREPSPVPQREIEEIIIRRPRTPSPTVSSISSRSPTPEPQPEPEPEPEPEPIRRPPIIQEIITHHRHIDHGVVRAPPTEVSSSSSSPSPSPPPVRRKKRDLEIDIVRKDARGNVFEEDIRIIDDSRSERSARVKPREQEPRKPSRPDPPPPAPAPRRLRDETNINIDLDLRGGTKSGPSSKDGSKDRWTEVAKDLVVRDAIEKMGYEYKENGKFFYVMEYLRFEDIAQLVDMTTEMRRRRDNRVETPQWEPEDPAMRPIRAPIGDWHERRYEREVFYEEPRVYRR